MGGGGPSAEGSAGEWLELPGRALPSLESPWGHLGRLERLLGTGPLGIAAPLVRELGQGKPCGCLGWGEPPPRAPSPGPRDADELCQGAETGTSSDVSDQVPAMGNARLALGEQLPLPPAPQRSGFLTRAVFSRQ